jgi:hypothetical protein
MPSDRLQYIVRVLVRHGASNCVHLQAHPPAAATVSASTCISCLQHLQYETQTLILVLYSMASFPAHRCVEGAQLQHLAAADELLV